MKQFHMTDAHLKLLRSAAIDWDDCEFGAPCIDPKRPYGNSDVVGDIARIIGLPIHKDDDGEYHTVMYDALVRLHRETETALQIVLATGTFEPGVYYSSDYGRDWKKAQKS